MAIPPATDPAPPPDSGRVNFFRPLRGFMRSEVVFIWLALIGWALLTFGFQFLLFSTQTSPDGQGEWTRRSVFGFPFHFWFTGQFLIVWFIFLCFLFNVMVDRLTERHRKRR